MDQILVHEGYCTGGILPVNARAEVNILNLNYVYRFIFYSSIARLSNDAHHK